MNYDLKVELVDSVVVAWVTGGITDEAVRERHTRILEIAKAHGVKGVLFDCLHSHEPTFEVIDVQRGLNSVLKVLDMRIAIVVPHTRLAYVARLIFGDENYRVFYDDFDAAMLWLRGEVP